MPLAGAAWHGLTSARLTPPCRPSSAVGRQGIGSPVERVDLDSILWKGNYVSGGLHSLIHMTLSPHSNLGDCDGPIEAGHILPHAWDGESTLENLRPECRHHNRKFGGRIRKSDPAFPGR
jgi:hypothetical protein